MPTEIYFTKSNRVVLSIGAVIGWFALLLQLYLIVINRKYSVLTTIVNYFSFYTILTNLLVAICYTMLVLKPLSRWGQFFSRSTTLTAICIYITVVGLIYNVVLRPLWHPEGMNQVADELLHSVIPLYYIFFWIGFVPKKGLTWSNTIQWLIYPLLYCVYVLVRGFFTDLYPYPFIDVKTLGYPVALLNCAMVSLCFFVVSLIYVGLARLMSGGTTRSNMV